MNTESTLAKSSNTLLFTCDPDVFWKEVRQIIREETRGSGKYNSSDSGDVIPIGNQSLYKIKDLCRIFSVSKPTIYEWIRMGKLKPKRIKRRVFFLEKDLKDLLD
jgi:hypothetical protein